MGMEGMPFDGDALIQREYDIRRVFFLQVRNHPSSLYMSSEAMAPVIISTSSPVITAWRVRLKRIWYLEIISPAFLEAFLRRASSQQQHREFLEGLISPFRVSLTSMALRRADCSQAWPSARAQKRELARAYSRMLASSSSSTSKAEKLAAENSLVSQRSLDVWMPDKTHRTRRWPPRRRPR